MSQQNKTSSSVEDEHLDHHQQQQKDSLLKLVKNEKSAAPHVICFKALERIESEHSKALEQIDQQSLLAVPVVQNTSPAKPVVTSFLSASEKKELEEIEIRQEKERQNAIRRARIAAMRAMGLRENGTELKNSRDKNEENEELEDDDLFLDEDELKKENAERRKFGLPQRKPKNAAVNIPISLSIGGTAKHFLSSNKNNNNVNSSRPTSVEKMRRKPSPVSPSPGSRNSAENSDHEQQQQQQQPRPDRFNQLLLKQLSEHRQAAEQSKQENRSSTFSKRPQQLLADPSNVPVRGYANAQIHALRKSMEVGEKKRETKRKEELQKQMTALGQTGKGKGFAARIPLSRFSSADSMSARGRATSRSVVGGDAGHALTLSQVASGNSSPHQNQNTSHEPKGVPLYHEEFSDHVETVLAERKAKKQQQFNENAKNSINFVRTNIEAMKCYSIDDEIDKGLGRKDHTRRENIIVAAAAAATENGSNDNAFNNHDDDRRRSSSNNSDMPRHRKGNPHNNHCNTNDAHKIRTGVTSVGANELVSTGSSDFYTAQSQVLNGGLAGYVDQQMAAHQVSRSRATRNLNFESGNFSGAEVMMAERNHHRNAMAQSPNQTILHERLKLWMTLSSLIQSVYSFDESVAKSRGVRAKRFLEFQNRRKDEDKKLQVQIPISQVPQTWRTVLRLIRDYVHRFRQRRYGGSATLICKFLKQYHMIKTFSRAVQGYAKKIKTLQRAIRKYIVMKRCREALVTRFWLYLEISAIQATVDSLLAKQQQQQQQGNINPNNNNANNKHEPTSPKKDHHHHHNENNNYSFSASARLASQFQQNDNFSASAAFLFGAAGMGAGNTSFNFSSSGTVPPIASGSPNSTQGLLSSGGTNNANNNNNASFFNLLLANDPNATKVTHTTVQKIRYDIIPTYEFSKEGQENDPWTYSFVESYDTVSVVIPQELIRVGIVLTTSPPKPRQQWIKKFVSESIKRRAAAVSQYQRQKRFHREQIRRVQQLSNQGVKLSTNQSHLMGEPKPPLRFLFPSKFDVQNAIRWAQKIGASNSTTTTTTTKETNASSMGKDNNQQTKDNNPLSSLSSPNNNNNNNNEENSPSQYQQQQRRMTSIFSPASKSNVTGGIKGRKISLDTGNSAHPNDFAEHQNNQFSHSTNTSTSLSDSIQQHQQHAPKTGAGFFDDFDSAGNNNNNNNFRMNNNNNSELPPRVSTGGNNKPNPILFEIRDSNTSTPAFVSRPSTASPTRIANDSVVLAKPSFTRPSSSSLALGIPPRTSSSFNLRKNNNNTNEVTIRPEALKEAWKEYVDYYKKLGKTVPKPVGADPRVPPVLPDSYFVKLLIGNNPLEKKYLEAHIPQKNTGNTKSDGTNEKRIIRSYLAVEKSGNSSENNNPVEDKSTRALEVADLQSWLMRNFQDEKRVRHLMMASGDNNDNDDDGDDEIISEGRSDNEIRLHLSQKERERDMKLSFGGDILARYQKVIPRQHQEKLDQFSKTSNNGKINYPQNGGDKKDIVLSVADLISQREWDEETGAMALQITKKSEAEIVAQREPKSFHTDFVERRRQQAMLDQQEQHQQRNKESNVVVMSHMMHSWTFDKKNVINASLPINRNAHVPRPPLMKEVELLHVDTFEEAVSYISPPRTKVVRSIDERTGKPVVTYQDDFAYQEVEANEGRKSATSQEKQPDEVGMTVALMIQERHQQQQKGQCENNDMVHSGKRPPSGNITSRMVPTRPSSSSVAQTNYNNNNSRPSTAQHQTTTAANDRPRSGALSVVRSNANTQQQNSNARRSSSCSSVATSANQHCNQQHSSPRIVSLSQLSATRPGSASSAVFNNHNSNRNAPIQTKRQQQYYSASSSRVATRPSSGAVVSTPLSILALETHERLHYESNWKSLTK